MLRPTDGLTSATVRRAHTVPGGLSTVAVCADRKVAFGRPWFVCRARRPGRPGTPDLPDIIVRTELPCLSIRDKPSGGRGPRRPVS